MELDRLNAAEPSIVEQVRKRALLIGRHDYWPGYTPEVIKSLDFDYWPELALLCDAITEQHQRERKELEQHRRGRKR